MNVYQKLNAARTKFHGLQLKKTGHNKFAGYYYFELGDFLIPALKVFEEVGLCATVSFEKDIAQMCIRNVDKPEEFICLASPMGSAALKGCHEVQNIGAVETYQRRYLWVAALEIVEHDALDATTGKANGDGSLVPVLEASIAQAKAKKAGQTQPVNPPKNGAVAAVLESLPKLTPEWEKYYKDKASEVCAAFGPNDDAGAALQVIQDADLSNEERIHLDARLPSNVRSAIKRHQETERA